jgi:hypothetical protein
VRLVSTNRRKTRKKRGERRRKEKGDITRDATKIHRIIREYF